MVKRNTELKVETKWTYVDKPSPQFAKLMSLLLLKPRNNLPAQTKGKREVNDD